MATEELPTYPAWDYDQGRELMNHLGSFWLYMFEDRDLFRAYLRGTGMGMAQTYINFLETVAATSRFDVPVFHKEFWYSLTLKQSEAGAESLIYQPDDAVYGPQPAGGVYSEGRVFRYGDPGEFLWNTYELPDDVTDIPYVIVNKVVDATVVYFRGIDFHVDLDRRLLYLRYDPFENDGFAQREVFEGGEHSDNELSMWLFNIDVDLDYIYTHFGYVLNVALQSSQFYKDLVNAFWDMCVSGTSESFLVNMFAAITGIPTVKEAAETVEVIRAQPDALIVVTDKTSYRFPTTATPIVSVGEEVSAGDQLVDSVDILVMAGHDNDYASLTAISLGEEFLSGDYFSELMFQNKTVPLEWHGYDEDGKSDVRFEITGFPGDIELFWDLSMSRGKLYGKTLAEWLDTRADPVGQPTAANLPATINPLGFVVGEVMRNNLFVVSVNRSAFHPDAPGLEYVRMLREVVPPRSTFIVFVEINLGTLNVDMTATGLDLSVFTGPEEIVVTYSGQQGLAVTARLVSGVCK